MFVFDESGVIAGMEDPVRNKPTGSDVAKSLLSGSLCNLPDIESSVVRIFLSSTFTGKVKSVTMVTTIHCFPILQCYTVSILLVVEKSQIYNAMPDL